MSAATDLRHSLISYVMRQLVGPEGAEPETLSDSPTQRYISGILFPQARPVVEIEDAQTAAAEPEQAGIPEAASSAGDGNGDVGDDSTDDPVRLANSYYPSAIGLSCVIGEGAERLKATISGASYESKDNAGADNRREWVRKAFTHDVEVRVGVSARLPVRPGMDLVWTARPLAGRGVLATAVVLNTRVGSEDGPPKASDCLFQLQLALTSFDGHPVFSEYRTDPGVIEDPEEVELELLYRNRRVFAVGHGCAADWISEAQCATEVRTAVMPAVMVPPVVPTTEGGVALSMQELGGLGATAPEGIPDLLDSIPAAYGAWVADRRRELPSIPERLRAAAAENVRKCEAALSRVRGGIDLLRRNSVARDAFILANRAMLMQQYHSKLPRRLLSDAPNASPRYVTNERRGSWRTFQIAFVLMNLTAFGNDADREACETVDLIWFPTGGGKTEAYLGLIAYTMFRERLEDPSRSGCVALMRYTLRLLTSNQFQRACALICACEKLRVESRQKLGTERFTIGLWAGQGVSPNTHEEALKAARALAGTARKGSKADDAENPFQLLSCPWCGTQLDKPGAKSGYQIVGQPKTVRFVCPETACEYSKLSSFLPVSVVDEQLYDSPPTLLIGTVDKFAMLAWAPRSGAIFNVPKVAGRRPPSLIIQDELHLISGPLGSMVGLYESAIEALASDGRRPKIVASTATIRRAASQVLALYGRERFAQFPPPGLDASDSFFARESRNSPGRIYVGVFPSASPSAVTALVRAASALLQGALAVPLTTGAAEGVRDPYWTLVQYFSSLRELGRAATLVEADIPEHIAVMRRRDGGHERKVFRFAELTSRLNQQEIPERLEELRFTYPGTREKMPLDTVLATNMISVGVDVDRLGLMLIAGQPKSTSEYIQASSRVGRSDEAPGLVAVLFNSGKPRDRSHYEQFRAFHDAFYRFVEPTSVTPFSLPALDRALHAVMVIVARHLCGVTNPAQVANAKGRLDAFSRLIVDRCRRVTSDDPEAVAYIEALWESRIEDWSARSPVRYGTPMSDGNDVPLMYMAGSSPSDETTRDIAWPTPTSMRNVDSECLTEIVQSPVGPRS